jgi:hypothetical protein
MVIGGTNSMVISAACHISSVTTSATNLGDDIGNDGMIASPPNLDENTENDSIGPVSSKYKPLVDDEEMKCLGQEELGLLRLSRSLVQWGVVPHPKSYPRYNDSVGHLSFGRRNTKLSHRFKEDIIFR